MTLREWVFAAVLAAAGVLISYGVYLMFDALGFVVGGLALGGWAWLVLSEVD